MLCAYALRDSRFSALGFRAIVTVATPFYGTSTQQDRYYRGEEGILNKIYGAKAVVDIVASLPGPYTLMFLPKEIYIRDGRKLGLNRYPQLDPNGNVDADPYDAGSISRWPRPTKDHRQFLSRARDEMVYISQPIDPSIASVFFNVRSSLDTTTAVELLWNNIDGDSFIPGTTPSPLSGIAGPGDGTVPAWSGWHAYCRPSNRYELKRAKNHGALLQHAEVLALIDTVVKTRKLPTSIRKRSAGSLPIASSAKTARVINDWVGKAKSKKPLPRELFEKPVQRAIVTSLIAGKKPRMVRRRK
jgi:hypothetical protein